MKEEKKTSGYWTKETCREAAKTCKTRGEFQHRINSAYQKSWKNKWLDEFFGVETRRKTKGYWTKEACYEVARQCGTRTKFARKFSTAYHNARKNGWLDEYTWFVDGVKLECEKRTKWNKQTCYEAAKQCETIKQFETLFSQACKKSRDNGWIKDYTWFVDGRKLYVERRTYWTKEACYEAAKQCKTRTKFARKFSTAYHNSCKNGWIKDYTWFVDGNKLAQEKHTKWNKQTCYEAAKQCKTRTEFETLFSQACKKSRDNGWIKDYTWFVDGAKLNAEKRTKWNKQTCYEAAKQCKTRSDFSKKFSQAYKKSHKNRWMKDYTWFEIQYNDGKDYIYVYEFPNNVIYVGRSVQPKQRDYQHIFKEDSVSRYVKEHNNGVTPKMQIIEECDNATIGSKREIYWMDYYKNNGYTLLNKVKGGAVGSLADRKWTKETCREAAKQCKTRSEFKRMFESAYHKTRKNGWLKEYTWFVDGNKLAQEKRTKWNEETCRESALQCKTKKEFQTKFSAAYQKSLANGWLDIFFGVSEYKPRGYWNNYEHCHEQSLKYSTRTEFYKGCRSAYISSTRNGWLDDFFPKTKQAA